MAEVEKCHNSPHYRPQLKLSTLNNWKCPWYYVGRSEIQNSRYPESLRHITRFSGFDFEGLSGHENAMRKMGAAVAHNRPQRQWCDNIKSTFGFVYPNTGRVLLPFQIPRWNIHHHSQKTKQKSKELFSLDELALWKDLSAEKVMPAAGCITTIASKFCFPT